MQDRKQRATVVFEGSCGAVLYVSKETFAMTLPAAAEPVCQQEGLLHRCRGRTDQYVLYMHELTPL